MLNAKQIARKPIPIELNDRADKKAAEHDGPGGGLREERSQRHCWGCVLRSIFGGSAICEPPKDRPNDTEDGGRKEGGAEPIVLREVDDKWRCNDGTNHATAVEDTDCKRSFARGEYSGHCFRATGVVPTLAGPHPKARDTQLRSGPHKGLRTCRR
jgi:hypothetical protein